MKRIFVWTLMALLSTTNLYAFDQDTQTDTKFAGNVYASLYACTWFEFPYANAAHNITIENYGPTQIKCYASFSATVYWNGGDAQDGHQEQRWIPGRSWDAIYPSFSFNLRHKRKGRGRIEASTNLDVRNLATMERLSWTPAFSRTRFRLR